MGNLPDKDKLLRNFARCINWEERYLYIIELGSCLTTLPSIMRTQEYLVVGCQSQVWIILMIDKNGNVQLYGDSDAAIVKGLIAIVFVIYQKMTPAEIIAYDIYPIFNTLALTKHLTLSRSQGLEAIVRTIRTQAAIIAKKSCTNIVA